MLRQSSEAANDQTLASRIIEALSPETQFDTPTIVLLPYVQDESEDLTGENCDAVLAGAIEFGLVNPDAIEAWRSYLTNYKIPQLERDRPYTFMLQEIIQRSLGDSGQFID